jgi:hypothetical protein
VIEDFKHTLAGGDALLQGTAHVDQAAQRRGNQHQCGQKRKEIVDFHVVGKHLTNRYEKHTAERDRGNTLHHRVTDRPGAHQFHVRCAIVLVDLLESFRLMILGIEDLDQAMRIDGFLGDTRDVAHRILDALAVAPESAVRNFHQPSDDGGQDDAEQREAPIHIEQVDEQRQDGQTVADE